LWHLEMNHRVDQKWFKKWTVWVNLKNKPLQCLSAGLSCEFYSSLEVSVILHSLQ
jgi:hypothetical protein